MAKTGRRSDRKAKKTAKVVSRADLARLRGVSRAAVSQLLRPGKPLYPAISGSGVNVNHPSVKEWLAAGLSSGARPQPGGRADPSASRFGALAMRRREVEVQILEVKRARESGDLIARALVSTFVLGHLERLHLRLLRDLPGSLAPRLAAAARSGAIDSALAATIREAISSELAAAKKAVVAGLCASRSSEPPQ